MSADVPASIQSMYDRMSDQMIPFVRQHLVAIAAYYGGELRQHATGSLVRFADHYFLVTAAHAIDDYCKGLNHYSYLQLYLDNGNATHIVPLFGHSSSP
jgi:hypothetical protein